jgi:alkanesulfonate monooxygenase SsuD/methylene tetrahydromethanopterin reductase-like flavin-dependent oxidoreductase (luciferase family)
VTGAAVLGIGRSWTKAEFEMMGMAFDVKPRLRMLTGRAHRVALTQERTTLAGEFYKVTTRS